MHDSAVTIAPGETATLELKELGSAGYLWSLDTLDPAVVRIVTRTNRRADEIGGERAIGGTTTLALVLEGVAPGTAMATLRRPWLADGDAAGTLVVTCA